MGRGVRILSQAPAGNIHFFLAASICALAVPCRSPAQSDLPLKFQFALATIYDNNILRYSERYLSRFDNREDPGRFRIETTDDLIAHFSARAEKPFELFPALLTSFAFEGHYWKYARNDVKSWPSLLLTVRQELPGRLGIGASYSYLPDFYVRHYRDDDWVELYGYVPATFQSFSFERGENRLWLQAAVLQNTRLRVTRGLAWYYHNEHFTEYDSRNDSWAFDLSHPLVPSLRVSGGYGFITSQARGSGQLEGATTGVGVVDASYDEDEYTLGIEWRHPRFFGRTGSISLAGEYSRRCFLTTEYYEIDDMHAGRVDKEYLVALTWALQMSRAVDLSAGLTWRARDATTTTPFAQEVSDEKDYKQTQIMLSFIYTLQIQP